MPLTAPDTARARPLISRRSTGRRLSLLLGLLWVATGCRAVGLPGDLTPLTGATRAMQPTAMQPAWRVEVRPEDISQASEYRQAGPGYDPAQDRIAVAGRDGELLCLNARSGDILWRSKIAGNGQDRAVFSGDLVLVGTDDGVLAALDSFTGEQRWIYEVQGVVARAPVVVGDRVVFVDGTNAIYGLDRKTGQWRWQYRREAPAEFALAGEAAPAVANGRVFTGFSDGTVVALALDDGATLWTRDLAPEHDRFQDADATPAVLGSTVVAASAAGGIYGLDVESGAIRWHLNRPGTIGLMPLDGDVVASFDQGQITRLAGYDGRTRWETRLPIADGLPSEPLRVGRRFVAVAAAKGTVHLLDEFNGRPIRQFRPGSGIHGAPAAAPDGSLFVLSDGGVLYSLRPPIER